METLGSEASEAKATTNPASSVGNGGESAQLGGARAEFVASLGRKVEGARALLAAIEADPPNTASREELRRKLHALGSGARMLHFDVMTRTLGDADAIFERATKKGVLASSELAELSQVLDDLPALAWAESPSRDAMLRAEAEAPVGPMTRSALIFGGDLLAEALSDEGYGGAPYDCERTESVQAALGLARSLAPDVVLVDADLPGALEVVEALLDDPLTEPVPILVVGSFGAPEQAARHCAALAPEGAYIALGVAKTISKPISPESLRQIAEDAASQREGRTARVPLGEPTLEQLGNRLADEVRNALVECVDAQGRACRVPLGEGTEVLGAIWGAIARVREVVSARTDGSVTFASRGPEGAIAIAPWMHPEVARSDRSGPSMRTRGPAVDVKLAGRKVVVADDDPGVTWFISDLLKTAGCTVYEALDGNTALELAYEHSPELVVSDILMPGLDGFALSRALKRDVGLRDVPVVLLSWKEDLLQRVRELGASAAAYLRKESDSRAIVARVREVLRPRARIEARLKADGEIRGRLDGLTVRALLELVCTLRPSSRISVRDASFLYEMEIRDGAPRRATRTAGDGSFQRGEPVIAAMLGVGAGRFTVAESTTPVQGDLTGSLASQLRQPLANARGALHAVTGARIMGVERLLLDEAVLEAYLRATPDPARALIEKIADGASPRAVLLGGNADPGLLEDVLCDLASRGAVLGVLGAGGADLLAPAIVRALAVMQGEHRPPRSVPPSARPSAYTKTAPRSSPPSASMRSSTKVASAPRWPASLADAVMKEIDPTGNAPSSIPPPIIETARLRPRSSNPPPNDALPNQPQPNALSLSADMSDKTDVEATKYGDSGNTLPMQFAIVPVPTPEPSIPITIESSQPQLVALKEDTGKTMPAKFKEKQDRTEPAPEKTPLASVTVTDVATPPKQVWQYAAVLAGAVAVVWVAFRMSGPPPSPEPDTMAHAGNGAPMADTPPHGAVTFADIAPGSDVPPGQGILEVSGASDDVRVDDVARGRGLKVTVQLIAGNHEVKVGPDKKIRVIEVRAGRTTRFEVSQVP